MPARRRRLSKGLIAGASSDTARSEEKNAAASPGPIQSPNDNVPEKSAAPSLPSACYSGRLAAVCAQNALQLGLVAKYALCPQGKARKTLLSRAKNKRHRSRTSGRTDADPVADAHERAEEEFMNNPAGADLAEYSSGDDDDFDASVEDDEGWAKGVTAANLAAACKEPLFIPTGTDAASMGLQGGQAAGAGRLPFNYRKLRFFDVVTASDRAVARDFLRSEIANAKKLRSTALSNHLRKAQLKERERIENEAKGVAPSHTLTTTNDSDMVDEVDLQAEQTALATALTRFPQELTPTMSASLLIESLAMNHHESIEGMARCYDGIVSAGTALLDIANETSRDSKPKLTTSEIMVALAPLLITTLEQPSGEAIVELAKLRNFCGTKRYQRRFVQRIAPFLVRPSDAAIWCLRHQTDIEPIMAAVEMILDNAADVFSSGWFERGRNMLKDTQRAEKLRLAASQLRCLNSPSPVDGLFASLSSLGGSHRRGSLFGGSVSKKESQGIGDESMAEWEVLAIDMHIRQSVLDVFSRDWSRISSLNLSPKESDTSSYGSRQRRGISATKSKSAEWQHDTTGPSMSASSLTKSPRSKIPLSPRGGVATPLSASTAGSSQVPSADALESTFGPSFSSQVIEDDGFAALSSSNHSTSAPLSPKRAASSKLTTPKTPPTKHDFRNDEPSSPGGRDPSRIGLAPLSPQSSVGNASASSMGTMSQKSMSVGQRGSKDQYRALTSTAAERKRTVAACRALRAQITKFEEAFIQMHGRAPKGAAEREPLASTYMQYREWKRAIRTDAACRIQALCRGSSVRSMMLRSHDVRVSRIVSRRSVKPTLVERRTSDLSHLSIPLDIGTNPVQSSILDHVAKTRLEARGGLRGDDGVEVVMRSGSATTSSAIPPSVAPNWKNRQQVGHSGGDSPGSSFNQRPSPGKPRNSQPDVTVMSLPELQQRKRELKQQLKMYDLNFHAQHGRMPEKREKEPIRHLYESYNAYKNQISAIEKGEAEPGPGTTAFRGRSDSADAANTISSADSSPDRNSPTDNPSNVSPGQVNMKSSPKNASEFIDDEEDTSQNDDNVRGVSQDLSSLKAEKATLHQMLRSYEKDFFKQHKRQVSSFSDIRPVASQYRRYKEIKKAISAMQDK